jgi:hypothetical protein
MPLFTQVHIDKALTNMTLEFPTQMFMSDAIFPNQRICPPHR